METGRLLVVIGVVSLVAGLLWPWLSKAGFGRLPGDFVIEWESVRIYVPIMTSIIASVVLSLVLWLLGR